VLGAGEEPPLFLPTPPFSASAGEEQGLGSIFLCHFICYFFGAHSSLGIGLGGGHKGSLQRTTLARTAEGKTGQNLRRHDLYRSHASMDKQKKNPTLVTHLHLRHVSQWSVPPLLDHRKYNGSKRANSASRNMIVFPRTCNFSSLSWRHPGSSGRARCYDKQIHNTANPEDVRHSAVGRSS